MKVPKELLNEILKNLPKEEHDRTEYDLYHYGRTNGWNECRRQVIANIREIKKVSMTNEERYIQYTKIALGVIALLILLYKI